jgi:hypothetical protein
MANKLTKVLQGFFNFGTFDKKTSTGLDKKNKEVYPIVKTPGGQIKKAHLSTQAQKFWDWYNSQNNDTAQTLQNRFERYEDMDYMVYNDTSVSFSAELYADESAQIDDDFNLINVKASKSAVEKEIYKLLDFWGIDQGYIRDCAYNLVVYGDSVDVLDVDDKEGITAVTPIDVRDLTDRLEFKLSEVKKKMSSIKKWNSPRNTSVNGFINDMEKDSSLNLKESFQSYLLGFVLSEDQYAHPWQVNHYRLYSRRSEFWPFGRPMFINLIGPFRQLKTSLNLMALARSMSFPKEVYEVKISEGMTAIEQWDAVNEARQEYENLGILNKKNDEFSIGDQIWLPEGLVRRSQESLDVRPENINDIELLRDNLIMGTRIPKGYLIVDRGGWGNSSQSLLQQSKPFARAVYTVQSSIIKNISHLIRLHFLITGKFEKEFTEFQISLNYPVVEEASDRLRMKQDSLRLAQDVISNIKDALGLRDEVPGDVVKKIFTKFSFLSPEEINLVVDGMVSTKSVEEQALNEKIIKERLNEDIINSSYFEAVKNLKMKEGFINKKHFVTSSAEFIPKEFKGIYSMYREHGNKDNRIKG